MERNKRFYVLTLSYVIFMLQWAYMIIPVDGHKYQPFPFDDQKITMPTYYDYIFRGISYIIAIHLLWYVVPALKKHFALMFFIWCGFLLDYVLCYNNPFHYLGGWFPISYSLFAGAALVLIPFIDYNL